MYSIWIGWIKICRVINNFIESIFEVHTRFVTSHHTLVIALCLLFLAIMAVGAKRFKALERNEELFIPQGSEAFKDLEKGGKLFKDLKFRAEEFIITYKDGRSIFDNNKALLKALQLHNEIIKLPNFKKTCLTTETKEEEVNFLAEETGNCIFISPLEVFNYKTSNIEQANTPIRIINKFNFWLANPNLLFPNGRPASLNYRVIFGNYAGIMSNVIFSDAIKMTYFMKYVNTSDSDYNTMVDMEDEYIKKCEEMVKLFDKDGINLFYYAARTVDDAMLDSIVGDLPQFSVGLTLMVVLCLFAFLRIKHPVSGHLTIGTAGIFVIILGVGSGFGLAMWTGNEFVAFIGVVMFLILGIGELFTSDMNFFFFYNYNYYNYLKHYIDFLLHF